MSSYTYPTPSAGQPRRRRRPQRSPMQVALGRILGPRGQRRTPLLHLGILVSLIITVVALAVRPMVAAEGVCYERQLNTTAAGDQLALDDVGRADGAAAIAQTPNVICV